MFLLMVTFSKRLSVFTGELCQAMDQMISGSGEPVRAADSETLASAVHLPSWERHRSSGQSTVTDIFFFSAAYQGGYIKVVSEPGKGSEFSIMLPTR